MAIYSLYHFDEKDEYNSIDDNTRVTLIVIHIIIIHNSCFGFFLFYNYNIYIRYNIRILGNIMSNNVDATAAFEAEKEREAFLESIFKPFKAWYNKEGTKEEIKERKNMFGRFPIFWKGLKKWKHYEGAYAAYTQANNSGGNNNNNNNAVKATSDTTTNIANMVPTAVSINNNTSTNTTAAAATDTTGTKKRKRKSRWAAETNTSVVQDSNKSSRWSIPTADNLTGKVKILPSGFIVPAGLTMKDEDVFVYKIRLEQLKEKMMRVPEEASKRDADPDRSPSPEPVYNMQGIRTNGRLQRMTEACEKEEEKLMIGMLRADPTLRNTFNYRIVRKVYCPVKEFPHYNFIGLVLGPRGATQKQMEGETGCKIAIRGKGSIRAGRNVRQGSQHERSQNEDLHVLITGDDIDMVERTIELVKPLLRPLDDDRNIHKQRQLRQLALINGTLRESTYCNYCGEEGHAHYACPKRKQAEMAKLKQVRCAICGEVSHVTADCKYTKEELQNKKRKVDGDFQNFMAGLTGTGRSDQNATAEYTATLDSHNKNNTNNNNEVIPILNVVATGASQNNATSQINSNNNSNNNNNDPPPILNYGMAMQAPPPLLGMQQQQQQQGPPPILGMHRGGGLPRGIGMPSRGRGRGRGRGSAAMMKPAWMVQQEKEAAMKGQESGKDMIGKPLEDNSNSNGPPPSTNNNNNNMQQMNQFQPPPINPQMNQFQPPPQMAQFQQQQYMPPMGNFMQQPPPQMPMYGMYQQPVPMNTKKYAPDVSDWGD